MIPVVGSVFGEFGELQSLQKSEIVCWICSWQFRVGLTVDRQCGSNFSSMPMPMVAIDSTTSTPMYRFYSLVNRIAFLQLADTICLLQFH